MAPRFVGLNSTFDEQRIVINDISVDIENLTSSGIFAKTNVGINTFSNIGIGTTNPTTALQINGVLGFGIDQYGNTNIRIGDNTTGSSITDGFNNIFMGIGAGNYTTSGYSNQFLGGFAGNNNIDGGTNIFIGESAGYNNTSGSSNIFLNSFAGYNNINGNANNFLGVFAGEDNIDGYHNNFFGNRAGNSNKSGNYNIYLGPLSGISTAASRKIIIGSGGPGPDLFDSPNTTKDTQFAVGVRTDANPSKYWLVGDENFNIGIGTTNPTSTLTVVGNARIVGTTTITGNLNAPGNYYVKLARLTNQTVPQNTDTLIGFTATSDTNGWYSGITTRTTPTVAGTYNVNAMMNISAGSVTNNQTNIQLRKNGSTFAISQVGIQTFAYTMNACGIVTMNGTTDYIEFSVYTGDPGGQTVTGTSDGAWTKMEIFKIN